MAETADPIRVFLVDDHDVVRRGITAFLESEGDIEVVGEAATAADAIARIPAVRQMWQSSTCGFPTAVGWRSAARSAPGSRSWPA